LGNTYLADVHGELAEGAEEFFVVWFKTRRNTQH